MSFGDASHMQQRAKVRAWTCENNVGPLCEKKTLRSRQYSRTREVPRSLPRKNHTLDVGIPFEGYHQVAFEGNTLEGG